MTEQKKCENSNGIKFWLLKTLPTFNDYQDAKFEASISRNSHYYKSCDDISTFVYTVCVVVLRFFVIKVNACFG